MAAVVPALLGGIFGLIGHAQKQSLANRQADLQEEDSIRRQQEYNLRAQDFTREGAYRQASQATAYSRSGVLLSGSALQRLSQTRSRTAEGARRLRDTGAYERERGNRLADITRSSVGSPLGAFAGPFLSAFGSFGGFEQAGGFFGGLFPQQYGGGGGRGPGPSISVPRLSAIGRTTSVGAFTY